MKITHLFVSICTTLFWVAICAIILVAPLTIYLAFVHDVTILILTAGASMISFMLTITHGGFNTVPSILWRFRRNVDTRIIEIDGRYAAQFRLVGNAWMYIHGEPGHVLWTAWIPDVSTREFLVGTKRRAEQYLETFAAEIADGLKTPASMPEVLTSYRIINGERVKK